MFTIKDMKVLTLLILWSILLGPCYASQYNYVSYKANLNNSTVTLNVPIDFESENVRQWRSIGRFLVDSKYKTYVLNWRGYGGDTSYGKEFISYIQQAERQGKRIVIKLIGSSYSMHALVPCYATQIINNSNQFLMFHADGYSKYRTTRNRTTVGNQLQMCVSVRVMTQQKLDKMWAGYEVYINNTQTWYISDTRPVG
jgi:hypothetical protein